MGAEGLNIFLLPEREKSQAATARVLWSVGHKRKQQDFLWPLTRKWAEREKAGRCGRDLWL